MLPTSVNSKIAHPFQNVKPQVNTQIPLFPESMIHHKVGRGRGPYIVLRKGTPILPSYGVSSKLRILSPQLFLKKYDLVRDCLERVVGMTTGQREATLRLLRFLAYYGKVYPKAALITAQPGCSKATYWRTVRQLQESGLLTVINRFYIRPHAQTSNLYKFDKLLLLIARYLAEHGVGFLEKWLQPYLAMPGSQFWPLFMGILTKTVVTHKGATEIT